MCFFNCVCIWQGVALCLLSLNDRLCGVSISVTLIVEVVSGFTLSCDLISILKHLENMVITIMVI